MIENKLHKHDGRPQLAEIKGVLDRQHLLPVPCPVPTTRQAELDDGRGNVYP